VSNPSDNGGDIRSTPIFSLFFPLQCHPLLWVSYFIVASPPVLTDHRADGP